MSAIKMLDSMILLYNLDNIKRLTLNLLAPTTVGARINLRLLMSYIYIDISSVRVNDLSTRHSISLPNCKTPHIVRTYRSSLMAMNVLQSYFLFIKLDNIKELTA